MNKEKDYLKFASKIVLQIIAILLVPGILLIAVAALFKSLP